MVSLFIIILSLIFGFILKKLYDINQLKSQLPPSLPCKPLFGNVTYLAKPQFYKDINKDHRKNFKDFLTLWFFNIPIIIVNDYRKLVDLYVNKYPIETGGRPRIDIIHLLTEGSKGIFSSNMGPKWSFQRKLVHSSLRKFGQNVKLDNHIRSAFKLFKDMLIKKSKESGGIYPYNQAYFLSYNVTCAIAFGKTFEIGDATFLKLRQAIEYINDFFLQGFVYFLIPYSFYLPLPGIRRLRKHMRELLDYLTSEIVEHENSKQYLEEPNDILDYIIKEKEDYKLTNNQNIQYLDEPYIRQVLADVFFGGTDTTAVSTVWLIGLMATHPDIKAKVKEEVANYERTMNKEISVTDKQNLDYAQAVLNEILRYTSLAPLGVAHEVTADINYDGYTIPKGTQIMGNQYEFHYDKDYWDEPEKFNPNRFLDENGKLVAKKEGWMPFSCGRRVCVGESVAKADIFLILCLICKELDLEWCTERNGGDVLMEREDNTQLRYTMDYFVKFTESDQ